MRLLPLISAFILLASLPALGEVDVRLTTPHEQFGVGGVLEVVTNDPVLPLEGEIESDGGDVLLSVETPEGVSRLDATETPIRFVVLELGKTPRTVTHLLLEPVVEVVEGEERSFGARTLAVSASRDGRSFDAPRIVHAPSGVDTPDRRALARLPAPVSATQLRVEFLEGWQRRADKPTEPDVRLIKIGAVSETGSVLSADVILIGALFRTTGGTERFRFSIRLKEGRHLIAVTALQLGRADVPVERRSDSVTVRATLQSEIPRLAEQPFVLSDGTHILLRIPPGANEETLRAIHLEQEAPETVPVVSYAGNKDIRPGSLPVLVYRFQGRYQTSFRAEATASLPAQPPTLAVDGRREFPSTWVSNLSPMPIRWKVDLERVVTLEKIVLYARREGSVSYAPKQARLRVSSDGETFVPVVGQIGQNAASEVLSAFDDSTTTILLPTNPPARWVELIIEESKQANNVQINEIEFYDASGGRVHALKEVDRVRFLEPISVVVRYYVEEMANAGVSADAPLGVFLWNETSGEWEWSRAFAQPAESNGGYFALDVNLLTRLAVFPLAWSPSASNALVVRWSPNPFSPNGDGVADTTRLTVELGALPAPGAPPPDVTVRLYDLRAMLVQTLSDRAAVGSNALVLEWDGTDRNGRRVPIGPYLYEVIVRRNDGSRKETMTRNGLLVVVR